MTAFWIGLAVMVGTLMAIGLLRDRRQRRSRFRGRSHSTDAAEQRLREYRRQAMAESGFIVPSGMTHEVRGRRTGR